MAGENLFLVQHGWAAARGIRQGTRSPILRLYLPGDAIGLAELGLNPVPCVAEHPVSEALFNAVNAWSLMWSVFGARLS